jgi:structural maintenance of chromosomes protein 6
MKRAAEVSITLTNGGDESFRPLDYGNEITITRHFTENGNASYKIKSKTKKTISTSRAELDAILDHFSIDVDNPMNILTQGMLSCLLNFTSSFLNFR